MRNTAAPEMTVPHGVTDPGDDLAAFGFPTGAEGSDGPLRPAIGDPIVPSPVPVDDPRLIARRERMSGRRRRSATTPSYMSSVFSRSS